MAWTLNLTPLFDLGEYYTTVIPPLNGSIFSPPNPGGGGTPIDTVTSGPPTRLSLPFPSAASPPAGAGTVLVTDSTTGGDLVRAQVSQFPPSPATATLVTSPPALIDAPTLAAAAARSFVPPTAVPYWVRFAATVLTAGTWIPLVVSAGPPTLTLGSGTITLTIPATVVSRRAYFFVQTDTATLTLTSTPAPSHDPAVPSRIVNIPYSGHSLTGVPSLAGNALGLFLALLISALLESEVNKTIDSTARNLMAQSGLRPTTTAVFSARSIRITPGTAGTSGGINLQLALADLFGPAFVPGSLAVAVAPAPAAGVQSTYTVTVTNSATGVAIPGATVNLLNYSGTGGASTVSTATTDSTGRAIFTVTLRSKVTITKVVDVAIEGVLHEIEVERRVLNPTLTVSAAPFDDVTRTLL